MDNRHRNPASNSELVADSPYTVVADPESKRPAEGIHLVERDSWTMDLGSFVEASLPAMALVDMAQ